MLQSLSEYFYEPLIFWAVPLGIVVLVAVWRRARVWVRRHLSGKPTS